MQAASNPMSYKLEIGLKNKKANIHTHTILLAIKYLQIILLNQWNIKNSRQHIFIIKNR